MTPLFVVDLLTSLEIAEEQDPTVCHSIKRLKVAIRSSGYTEESLREAAILQMKERLGGDFIIIDDDE